jgi:hypothetical protein
LASVLAGVTGGSRAAELVGADDVDGSGYGELPTQLELQYAGEWYGDCGTEAAAG